MHHEQKNRDKRSRQWAAAYRYTRVVISHLHHQIRQHSVPVLYYSDYYVLKGGIFTFKRGDCILKDTEVFFVSYTLVIDEDVYYMRVTGERKAAFMSFSSCTKQSAYPHFITDIMHAIRCYPHNILSVGCCKQKHFTYCNGSQSLLQCMLYKFL